MSYADNRTSYPSITEMPQIYKKNFLPLYQNMYNCTPYQYTDWTGYTYQVIGKNGNMCRIKEGPKHCNFPMDVNQKRASSLIRMSNAVIQGKGYSDPQDPSGAYASKVEQLYCEYKY